MNPKTAIRYKTEEIKLQKTGALDLFRMAAAFLVVAIHTSPFGSISPELDFFFTRILGRIAVPFFLMVTGQFVFGEYFYGENRGRALRWERVWKHIRKLLLWYFFSILLYLPLGIYAGHYRSMDFGKALKMLFFDGTFYHLWYFPACITGILLVWVLSRAFSARVLGMAAAALYAVGLLGDSYYGLLALLPGVRSLYEAGFQVFSYTRNGIFLVPVFLVMGGRCGATRAEGRQSVLPVFYGICFGACFLLMTLEGFVLHHFAWQRHDSMYLFLLPCMYFLYRLISCLQLTPRPLYRKIAMWIYILHPAVIVAVRGAAKAADSVCVAAFGSSPDFMGLFVENSLVHYLCVSMLSLACGVIAAGAESRFRVCLKTHFQTQAGMHRQRKAGQEISGELLLKSRAWIELDREALGKNVRLLQEQLPQGCRLMPAVKADAYGYGAVLVARELNRLGVEDFCVASLQEGIELRKGGIRGNILILGYTDRCGFPLLQRYNLIQTVVDYEYAHLLEKAGGRKPFRVHLAIDTGMHRLGIPSGEFEKLQTVFDLKHLKIEGAFTHLCVADGKEEKDAAYTKEQASAFYQVIGRLRESGCVCPKIHLSSSYGLLNYPFLAGDYARVGIALYGVLSTKEDTENSPLMLNPVLSLKARVATVKTLRPGEAAGYGLCFVAEEEVKAAVLTIGYADGLPRALSCGKGEVLLRGKRARMIGRICMDQTLVDVTHIPQVRAGDIAILIGTMGEEEISVCDIAEQTGTITNEILSRLGKRLERAAE